MIKQIFKNLLNSMVWVTVVGLCPAAFAQTYVFDFTTTIGNGSFPLDLNILTLAGSSSNMSTYIDPLNVLTLNGTNYNNLTFIVINDLNLLQQNDDGFIIQAGSNGATNPPDVLIFAIGSGSIINGTSVSDLLTVLSVNRPDRRLCERVVIRLRQDRTHHCIGSITVVLQPAQRFEAL